MFRFILPSAAFLLTLASATPSNGAKQTLNKRANGVTWNVWDAAWQTYDYVVVGGGLTGITVAARLAENPSTSILVIEAGGDNRWDSRVYDIYNYGQAFNSELDWQFSADQGRNIVAYVSFENEARIYS
jgi:choline dehydrogenase